MEGNVQKEIVTETSAKDPLERIAKAFERIAYSQEQMLDLMRVFMKRHPGQALDRVGGGNYT
jgi:hypothetical protein